VYHTEYESFKVAASQQRGRNLRFWIPWHHYIWHFGY